MKLDYQQKVGVAVILMSVLLLGMGGALYWSIHELIHTANRREHSYHFITQLEEIFSMVQDAETNQRGFILTGQPQFLTPYSQAIQALPPALHTLEQLSENNTPKQSSIRLLESAITQKLRDLSRSIKARQTQGYAPAREIILTNRGRHLMNDIRHQVEQLKSNELAHLAQQEQLTVHRGEQSIWLMGLFGFLSVLVLGLLYLLIIRENSRRKLAEKNLYTTNQALEASAVESERRFWRLADQTPVVIWMTNAQGRPNYANRHWFEMTGIAPDSNVDETWRSIIHPEDKEALLSAFGEAISHREHFEWDYRIRCLDGQERWMHTTAVPRFTRQSEFVGYVGTLNDITEQKHTNDALERRVSERTAQLQAVNKELESFSYSVSHDLRAPLRTLDGFSQALLEDYSNQLDETGKRYLTRLREGSQQMAKLIDDMLDLSRLTRGTLHREDVDLSQLAREITTEFHLQEPERSADFLIQNGLHTFADKQLMRVVLQNLLGNAWKFTSHHPSSLIEFGCRTEGGRCVFFVKDNGAGFDMTYANKLFGTFQRLHDAQEFPGSGIGLATVQRIIHRHGGEIWAESAVEKGATFYFTLVMQGKHHGTQLHPSGRGQSERPGADHPGLQEKQHQQ